jgi:hypothetical protein
VDKVIPVVASRGEAEGLLASPSESG